MRALGVPDPLYVAARRVLLDALAALAAHHDSIVLVGAQAVYMHASEADLGVAPYTTDGDLALDPRGLAADPLLESALTAAGFVRTEDIGIWEGSAAVGGVATPVSLDLLVPESLGGAGRRGARIPPHSKNAARKVSGLEGALIDRDKRRIKALDESDGRTFDLWVAGPAALIVAKVHKILDRIDTHDRLSDKDALDILRLLRATSTDALAARFATLLANDLSRATAERALAATPGLFGAQRAVGISMAIRAGGTSEAAETVGASMVALIDDLLGAIRSP